MFICNLALFCISLVGKKLDRYLHNYRAGMDAHGLKQRKSNKPMFYYCVQITAKVYNKKMYSSYEAKNKVIKTEKNMT